jgi:hypothetical protein
MSGTVKSGPEPSTSKKNVASLPPPELSVPDPPLFDPLPDTDATPPPKEAVAVLLSQPPRGPVVHTVLLTVPAVEIPLFVWNTETAIAAAGMPSAYEADDTAMVAATDRMKYAKAEDTCLIGIFTFLRAGQGPSKSQVSPPSCNSRAKSCVIAN